MIAGAEPLVRGNMNMFKCFFLILIIQSFLSAYDVEKDEITYDILWSSPKGGTHEVSFSVTHAMMSHNGATYAIWVDSDCRAKIIKLDDEGPTEFFLDDDDYKVRCGDGHHGFTLGIDKEGYIHVVGDMHHYPFNSRSMEHLPEKYKDKFCMYWKSVRPEDPSEFQFMGDDEDKTIPGGGFTYSYFIRDLDGTLFFISRQWAYDHGAWEAGKIGLGMSRYDTQTGKWTALGSKPSNSPREAEYKLIGYQNNGVNGTAYQGLKTSATVDHNNRIHISFSINGDNSRNTFDESVASSSTHILYGYTDDKGETFRRIDGEKIENNIINTENGDVVDQGKWYAMATAIAVNHNGDPTVLFKKQNADKQVYWNYVKDGKWQNPVEANTGYRDEPMIYDSYGVLTVASSRIASKDHDHAVIAIMKISNPDRTTQIQPKRLPKQILMGDWFLINGKPSPKENQLGPDAASALQSRQ